MKKVFKRLTMLALLALTSASLAWGQSATIYMGALKAQSASASTGSGQVKLTWLDITGKPMSVDLAKQINYMAFSDPSFMSKDCAYDGPAAEVCLVGGTTVALDGMETAIEIGGSGSQIYQTSFLYFHAEAQPDNGSYFSEWQIIGDDNQYVTRMTSSMSPADPMGKIEYTQEWSDEAQDWVDVIDEENSIPLRTPCFKLLPDKENSTLYSPSNQAAMVALAQSVGANPNHLYAVFNKYLLSNPVATSASVDAVADAEAHLTVTVEVNGGAASLDAADFATFTFSNNGSGEWSYDLAAALASKEVVSEQLTRITIPVTYTYKSTGTGTKNSTMTISMAGANPSALNVNLSVEVLDPSRPEAFLLDGKDDADPLSGTLAAMLAEDISGYTNPILKLNKPVAVDLTFSDKKFTLDLNGNTAQAITISSDTVTIAYSKLGGSATLLTVNGGKAILNGGSFSSVTVAAGATLEQNGASISGSSIGISNSGTTIITEGTTNGTTAGVKSTGTLTVKGGTLTGAFALWVAGGSADVKKGTLSGTGYGIYSEATTTTKKLAAVYGGTNAVYVANGTTTINNGKFASETEAPLHLESGAGKALTLNAGYFKVSDLGIDLPYGKKLLNVSAGQEYNAGYRYFVGDDETAQLSGVGVCRIGTTPYAKLEDAIAYANNNKDEELVIVMLNDYTLPAGYYTLPAKATIVVPMSDTQEKEVNKTTPRVIFNDQRTATPYVSIQPTEFRRLTFAAGVNMDVHGAIELTCSQYASNEAYTSQPVGPYGRLVLEAGSHITMQSGSELRAWGFVTGQGEIDARRGATVREMFQMGDWKGAMTSVRITGMVKQDEVAPALWNQVKSDDSGYKIFPVTQYFIQNIESPVKYHPGAVLSTSAAVSEGLLGMSVSMAATDIAVVGVSGTHQAIFLMDLAADADNTWVRKWYDAENDIQVYDINSGAHIGSMVLDMGIINLMSYGSVPIRLNSAKFDLPLTCNFKIHLLSGNMDFKQNTCLLPGAEVEVDKESTVSVAKESSDPEHTGALYVYDANQWDKYAFCNEYNGSSLETGKAYTKVVRYAPSWNGRPTKRAEQTCPPSAAINVHGTFQTAEGFVYTSEGGANIFSSNADAGTFVFNQSAESAGTREVYQVEGRGTYRNETFYPAKLKNGVADPAYADTHDAEAGKAYCYTENKWNTMSVAADPCFMVDDYDTYYAKPQEYVALANGMVENDDHTYSDAAGTGRLFILMNDCQWWEVEKEGNLFHCIHPENDTYYYWGEDPVTLEEGWLEKKYTITWKNWNGDIIQTDDGFGNLIDNYDVPYGTEAEFFGTNPTREEDIDYTYDFAGWTPELGPVTQDVTYTATYTKQPRKYTIIFQNEGGVEIERHFLTHNEMPVCENVPTKVGHTLVWDPAIAAVTGDATYTATWFEDPPTEYAVTFFDYDGTTKLKPTGSEPYMVAVGAMPEAPADPAGKPATTEYEYEFDHWSPALETVSATSAKSYTAIYREKAIKYAVTFLDENGDEIETNEYAYGETPVCSSTPTKANTAQYSYTFRWTPQIETVRGAATYQAAFDAELNKYTVTLQTNDAAHCTLTGAGIYDYNTSITIHANVKSGYKFVTWQETGKGGADSTFMVTGDVTLTALIEREDPSYSRSVSNSIGTLCIPFDIPTDGIEGAVFYQLSGKDENGKLVFDEVTSLQAGHPYIFQATASEVKLYGSANAVSPVTVNQMIGSYSPFTLSIDETNKHKVVYIADGKFWFCDNLVGTGLQVIENRCYIIDYSAIGAAPNHAPARRVVLSTNATNVATDIDAVEAAEAPRKMLIDNILYIQRGDKLYNVEGQLVR